MNVAIFGGTFDPIHRGHLAVARAAQERFELGRVYFVPADVPPHKQRHPVTAFDHRYAMVALATTGHPSFFPSLIEAPRPGTLRAPSYSLETVRRFRAKLSRRDRLFFLIGIDAFMEIGAWYWRLV
jgi:nicotinate-nucleotide adenylyltransferase